jgi:excisionase family DNA binding protein
MWTPCRIHFGATAQLFPKKEGATMPTTQPHVRAARQPDTLTPDVQLLPWAAEQLGIGLSTAYRLASAGDLPGLFKVGAQYRISVRRFLREVHGESA